MMTRTMKQAVACVALTSLLTPGLAAAQSAVDANLRAYSRVSGVAGNLSSIGSDTLNNLMTLWAETFQRRR